MRIISKKSISLVISILFSISLFGGLTALASVNHTNSKSFSVMSTSVPTNVQNEVNQKFQPAMASIKPITNLIGINPSDLNSFYLGKGFNIYNYVNINLSTTPIYYFPVMYNNEIKLILTAGVSSDGSISINIGPSFAI